MGAIGEATYFELQDLGPPVSNRVKVHMVCPGPIRTDLVANSERDRPSNIKVHDQTVTNELNAKLGQLLVDKGKIIIIIKKKTF